MISDVLAPLMLFVDSVIIIILLLKMRDLKRKIPQ